jgi:hypothetical protein
VQSVLTLFARPVFHFVAAPLLAIVIALLLFFSDIHESPSGPPPAMNAPPFCIVVSDSSGKSNWVGPDTLVLASTATFLSRSQWYRLERGPRPTYDSWRPVMGDSIELAGHHAPRLRFPRADDVVGVELWVESRPALFAFIFVDSAYAFPRVRRTGCPTGISATAG